MFIFIHKCSKMNYFRKKSIHDIHKQIAEGSGDSHESLGRHLKTRDLASFGIAAIIGAGIFSTIGQASSAGGPAVIFSGFWKCIHIFLCCFWRNYSMDNWLGAHYGICNWKYHGCYFME
jgi:amino acid permease